MQNIDSQRTRRSESEQPRSPLPGALPLYLRKGRAFPCDQLNSLEALPPPPWCEQTAASDSRWRTGRQLTWAVLTRSPSPVHQQTQGRRAIRLRHQDRSSSYCRTHAGILGIVSLVELAANGVVFQECIISPLPSAVFSLKHHGVNTIRSSAVYSRAE